MRGVPRIAALVSFVTAAAATAAAQTAPIPDRRPVEVGVDWAGLTVIFPEGVLPIPSIRITAPFARRFAVEGFVGIPFPAYEFYYGVYGVQIKQTLMRRPRTELFATYGVMGGYDYSRASASAEIIPPFLPLGGVGVQYRIADRVALRTDWQGVVCAFVSPFAAMRASAGVSIPIGRLR